MKKLLNSLANRTNTYDVPVTYVQDGLSVSPSEMLRSANLGVPISSQLLANSNFDDGEISQLSDVPFIFRRGVDVGDIITYQEQCRSKVSNAYKNLNNHGSE